jgi:hypothetical protein
VSFFKVTIGENAIVLRLSSSYDSVEATQSVIQGKYMTHYIIVYLGGEQPSDPEESQKHFEKYREWLTSLGDAVVSALNPLKDTSVVKTDGTVATGSLTQMSGFSIIQANSIEAVLEMAKTCPFLEIGGSLEVSELMQM